MSSSPKYQPLHCKKCGGSGFYHPGPDDDTGTWHREDSFGNVQAFEKGFWAPHWYICPATTQGSEHREKMMHDMTDYTRRKQHDKDMTLIDKTPMHAPGQKRLPSEKLTPIDREIAAKLVVMEMCLEDIKRLIAQKAADI